MRELVVFFDEKGDLVTLNEFNVVGNSPGWTGSASEFTADSAARDRRGAKRGGQVPRHFHVGRSLERRGHVGRGCVEFVQSGRSKRAAAGAEAG